MQKAKCKPDIKRSDSNDNPHDDVGKHPMRSRKTFDKCGPIRNVLAPMLTHNGWKGGFRYDQGCLVRSFGP